MDCLWVVVRRVLLVCGGPLTLTPAVQQKTWDSMSLGGGEQCRVRGGYRRTFKGG